MLDNMGLFKEPDKKTETLTLRLSKLQKERIHQMAGSQSISAFVLALIGQENERQINEGILDFFDDGVPF